MLHQKLKPFPHTSNRSLFTYPAPKKLSDIMKIPLVKKLAPEDVDLVWSEYHANKHDVCAKTLTKTQFELLKKNSSACKMMLFPIFREGGYMNFISQFQDHCFLFTFLDDFRKNPQSANPYYCITLYDEFLNDKNRGLLRGDIGVSLSRVEGEYLMDTLIEYYCDSERYRTTWKFNHDSRNFSYEEHIRTIPKPRPITDKDKINIHPGLRK